jgi:hypothetical protein
VRQAQRRGPHLPLRLRLPLAQAQDLPLVEAFPAPIMRWTELLYGPAFRQHGSFALRENGGGTARVGPASAAAAPERLKRQDSCAPTGRQQLLQPCVPAPPKRRLCPPF